MKNTTNPSFGLLVLGTLLVSIIFINDLRGNDKELASCKAANQTCMDLPWPAPDPTGVLVIRIE